MATTYAVSEQDLILVLSELKLIIYGLPDSEEYLGIQHESCGVDSYSLENRARECMSMDLMVESSLGELSDTLCKDLIFYMELRRWMEDVAMTGNVSKVVAEMKEAYCIEDT